MPDVAKKLKDDSLFLRLNQIPNAEDAVANDVQYHRTCWVLSQRNAKISSAPQELEDIDRVIADIEVINKVENFLTENSDSVLDMKTLNSIYNELLETHDINYRRYLKQLLEENIPEIMFVRPPTRNASERICLPQGQSQKVEKCFQNCYDSYTNIFEAAKLVRKEVLKQEKWKFRGNFDGFAIPKSLQLLLRWIVAGPRNEPETSFQKQEFDRCVNIMAELLMNMVKTDKKLHHSSKRGGHGTFRNLNETPFTVGLGLHGPQGYTQQSVNRSTIKSQSMCVI